ncbi:nadh-ubiquinone oxidoreductase kda subunit [Diaporthe eres]|uniref:Bud22 domain-containing protein n=1 Tax=Diaporthe vaccinii TaxID=105482 RepID=A0ABR4EWL3_9PEZI|nr:nadh-ubiquinone oxidoreductase kda subunit [Diaporthe eres]
MPKRKRDDLQEKLEHHSTALSRALKVAKGFERQRMAKRQRDPKSTREKRGRIEKEIEVLKSLDLHSVAHAHLCSALLRIKAVAESPRLPDEVKNGVPKPDLTEEERAALHNVTSGLYNQPKVRATLDAAVADICRVLQVPVPDKKGKLKKGDKKSEPTTRKDPEEQPADRAVKSAPEEKKTKPGEKPAKSEVLSGDQSSDDEETEWGGLSDDDNEDEELVEKALSRFEDRLGGFDSDEKAESDDEDEYDTANEELDPMEITDESASEDSEDDEPGTQSGVDEDGSSDSEEGSVSVSGSESGSGFESESDSDVSAVSPPPKALRKDPKDGKYLPSLMGGYISGSESDASDIDVAPAARKNRRGQRARQAIWEKKFKAKAKHLNQEKAGRDSGWDLKRGAVDGSDRTPWKKGIKTPFERRSEGQRDEQEHAAPEPRRPRPPTKKDDEGPLHPSWEARKKAKEAQQTAAFQGKKITFD